MEPLESIIGYTFSHPALLAEALTHASLSYEQQRTIRDNQRLEFLGDAVLQLTLSHALYRRLPDMDEGGLTKTRASIVSTKALAKLARSLQLGRYVYMGRGEEAHGGRDRDSTLADVFEAILGAAFLDGGFEAASGIVERLMTPVIREQQGLKLEHSNPKGTLQEMTQDYSERLPTYVITSAVGPDHSKTYQTIVSWHDTVLGKGTGRSKKEAEIAAATEAIHNPVLKQMLARFRLCPPDSSGATDKSRTTE